MAEDNNRQDTDQEARGGLSPQPVSSEAPETGDSKTGTAPHEPRNAKPSLWQSIREILIILVAAALIAVLIQSFFIKAFIIPSSSMSPTLQIGDRVMVDRLTYYFRKPRRGDVIVFRYPPTSPNAMNTTNLLYWPFEQIGETLHLTHRTDSSPYVKRVIATEGETLEIKNGQVYIDGQPIKEDYKVPDNYNLPPTKIPKGRLFCMGDNRPNSRDSRYWGLVPIRSVIGKVFLIWWPLKHFGLPKK
jgi:signal peptidase I